MSDTKSPQDWAKDWQALQKQYWNAWSDLTRKNAGGMPDASTPWHEGLEQWSRLFAGAGKQTETVERLMSSAKGYVALMQSMLSTAAGQGGDLSSVHAWTDTLRKGFNLPGFDASLLDNPVAKALRDISGQGAKGFEQLASGAMPWLQQMQQEGTSWLHAPAFGYAREHQEHYQKMALAFADYQEAFKQYNALILKSSQRSFEILEDKLAERSEPGRQLESMRAFYDLWVDAAEEAYAEIALTDEFRKVYGDVVNAQMRVRSQMQQEVERVGVDLGMPTRTELNSVHKRLHDLRREVRDGKAAESNDERDAQIAALRAEIETLKRQLGNAKTAPAAAATKSTPAASATKAPAHANKRATRSKSRAAAVAKPPRALKTQHSPAASFGDAIAAMRKTGATKPARAKRSGGKA